MSPALPADEVEDLRQRLQKDDVGVDVSSSEATQNEEPEDVAEMRNDEVARDDGAVAPDPFHQRRVDERVHVQVPLVVKSMNLNVENLFNLCS